MRYLTGFFFAAIAAGVVLPGSAGAIETESVLSRERRVRVMTGPHGYRRPRRSGGKDPVAPLGEGDLAFFKGGLTSPEIKKLLDGYLDRMLAAYSKEEGFPADLAKYLGEDRDVAEVFVTAIDPLYDDIGSAAKVFEDLDACCPELRLLSGDGYVDDIFFGHLTDAPAFALGQAVEKFVEVMGKGHIMRGRPPEPIEAPCGEGW